jgi:acyl-CoA reductase-like NAD-dependent aldehyde dehydrogenase
LLAIADGLERYRSDIAHLEAVNVGKPIAQARADVDDVVQVFRYFAGLQSPVFHLANMILGFADKLYGMIVSCQRRIIVYL